MAARTPTITSEESSGTDVPNATLAQKQMAALLGAYEWKQKMVYAATDGDDDADPAVPARKAVTYHLICRIYRRPKDKFTRLVYGADRIWISQIIKIPSDEYDSIEASYFANNDTRVVNSDNVKIAHHWTFNDAYSEATTNLEIKFPDPQPLV